METLSSEEFEQRYGQGSVSQFPTATSRIKKPISNRIADVLGLGGAVDVFSTVAARSGIGPQTGEEGRAAFERPSLKERLGAAFQTAAVPGAALITGGSSVLGQVAAGGLTGYLFDVGSDLIKDKSLGEILLPGVGTAAGTLVPPLFKGVGATAGLAAGLVKRGVQAVGDSGAGQIVEEVAERVPRAFGRITERLESAQERAERIRTSSPEIGNAIKAGVDDVVIQAIEQADDPTKEAYRRMIEIAEEPRTGLKPATRPESVAGEVASEQYTLLDRQRQQVGTRIGEAVDRLSEQQGRVDVVPSQRQMRDILRINGIMPDISGVLQFQGTKYTPAQRAVIQQLYELATEGGEQMTARQIYNKDQLFSQLQRETRFGDVGDIIIDVPEGSMSLFRAFRNIYSNQLDQIAPEIRDLNAQYRKLRTLQDDVERSIVKSGNFQTTQNADPAEFAQTNLRRLFSDAQSAADYRQIYENLDVLSRELGYTGPRADDLAGFAQRLREIYPETVPETGFSGGISTGIRDVIGKVLRSGTPDVRDQQKALKELLGITEEQVMNPGQALAGAPLATDEENDTGASLVALAGLFTGKPSKAAVKQAEETLQSYYTQYIRAQDKNVKKRLYKIYTDALKSFNKWSND